MTQPLPNTSMPGAPGTSFGGSPAGLVDQAQDKMTQAMDQAQQTAGQVTQQAKHQATSQLESQKDRAVDSLVTIAQALRQTGQHLNQQQQGKVAEYVEMAAERVEGLTNHLRARDVPELLNETQDLARRNPGVFIGAAVVLGFAGARFLMSSGQRAAAQRRFGTSSGSGYPHGLTAPAPTAASAPYSGVTGSAHGSTESASRPPTNPPGGALGASEL